MNELNDLSESFQHLFLILNLFYCSIPVLVFQTELIFQLEVL